MITIERKKKRIYQGVAGKKQDPAKKKIIKTGKSTKEMC